MKNSKEKYDLVCSLGGNCSAAHNLRFRDKRPFSLPFDWCYVTSEAPFLYLAKGFKNNFSDFFLKENLQREEGNESHSIIYKDRVSGYLFPNHFPVPMEEGGGYEYAAKKMRRRIDRLLKKLNEADSVLFIIATHFSFDIKIVQELSCAITSLYPNKKIQFRVLQFSAQAEEETFIDNIHLCRHKRSANLYDFAQTNFEWSFLDDIEISSPCKSKNKWRLLSLRMFNKVIRLELSCKPNNRQSEL